MGVKSVLGWTVFLACAAFVTGIESPATFEPYANGWTKSTADIRSFADAHGMIFFGKPQPAAASGGRPRVNVSVEKVARGPIPFHVDTVGTVQPVASVAIRSRIDATIAELVKSDGDRVQAGDVLVKLDDRQVLTQIRQAEATLEKDRAAIEQSTRDASRAGTLLNSTSGPLLNLQNAQTAQKAAQAAAQADQAQLDNLKIQESWYTLSAPISGRLGVFSSKVGNIIRTADSTATGNLVTINQMSPIYVAFPIPQVQLASLREAIAESPVKVVATPQGGARQAAGEITVIDNLIDPGTGTVMVRATFPNSDEVLWPGQLCNVELTLRTEPDDVSVSRLAIVRQNNVDYVYTVDDNVAHKRKITLGRFQDGRFVVTEGLKGGEDIVDDGKDFLSDGAPVAIKAAPGSQNPGT